MIFVSQGHEKGIGVEVFLRSLSCLPISLHSKIKFIVSPKTLEQNTKFFTDHNLIRSIIFNPEFSKNSSENETMASLLAALDTIGPKDILLTLPSSKDQFIYQGSSHTGHTEFFRNYFKNELISMLFIGSSFHLLLLTEHISISQVAPTLKRGKIRERIQLALSSLNHNVKQVVLLGIDPHCGDKGAISFIDGLWDDVKNVTWPNKIKILGPISADSLLQNPNLSSSSLVVSAYHDQGLSLFKSVHGHFGINRTIGMPFMRLSPDHGTAFDLYNKGTASIQGTLHTLLYALKNQV